MSYVFFMIAIMGDFLELEVEQTHMIISHMIYLGGFVVLG